MRHHFSHLVPLTPGPLQQLYGVELQSFFLLLSPKRNHNQHSYSSRGYEPSLFCCSLILCSCEQSLRGLPYIRYLLILKHCVSIIISLELNAVAKWRKNTYVRSNMQGKAVSHNSVSYIFLKTRLFVSALSSKFKVIFKPDRHQVGIQSVHFHWILTKRRKPPENQQDLQRSRTMHQNRTCDKGIW